MSNKMTVSDLLDVLDDIEIVSGEDYLDKQITVSDVYRPALELTGYFKFYPKERVQLFGKTEISYINSLSEADRIDRFEKLVQAETPMFLVSRGLDIPEELLEQAKKIGVPVLSAKRTTTQLSSRVTNVLDRRLAERKVVHGVLVDINGMGILIQGQSGIGKSETALDLIRRGHRLVSDDRVDLYTTDNVRIHGEGPEVTKHMLEVRGVGIIDVINLFGVGSVRDYARVDLIVHLELWDNKTQYDRLGQSVNTQRIFDVDIPSMIVPVSPGRNIAIIIETAAMTMRARAMGYNATEQLMENINKQMEKNKNK